MTNQQRSITTLTCGILSIVGSVIPLVKYFTFFLAIAAIVLGLKGRKSYGTTAQEQKYSTIGLVLGGISVLLTILSYISAFMLIGALLF